MSYTGSFSRYGRSDTSKTGTDHGGSVDILDEPASRNGFGSAGSLSTGNNSHQSMLEKQRELQRQRTKQRMAGSMLTSRSLDSRSGIAAGQTGMVPQFSAPQRGSGFRGNALDTSFGSVHSPPRTLTSVGSPMDTSFVSPKRENFSQAAPLTPSVEDVIRQRAQRRSFTPREDSGHSVNHTEKILQNHHLASTYDPNEGMNHNRSANNASPSRIINSPTSATTGNVLLNQEAGDGNYIESPVSPAPGNISDTVVSPRQPFAFNFSDMRSFLYSPVPREAGTVQCYIEREKTGIRRMYPQYSLYMKDGERFLLVGKKRPKQRTSNYLMSMDRGDLSRDGNNFIGKVRSNMWGTEFVVYDDGLKPADAKRGGRVRREMAVVTYASHFFGTKGPRKMKLAVPKVDKSSNEPVVFRPEKGEETMADMFRHGHIQHMSQFVNKPPKWNDQVGAYVLNFNGRVTMASVKNFQLVTPDDHETVALQFGRVGKDLFTMDFRWPLSPMQAFGVCLSSFDFKFACD